MEKEKRVMTRRDFLKAGACTAAGGLMGFSLPGSAQADKTGKSRVVLVRDKDVFEATGLIRKDVLQRMLDRAMMVLFDSPDPASPWSQLFRPDDTVGIKSNMWNPLPTPRELEEIIAGSLLMAGVQGRNMDTDDRGVLQNPVFQKATALINVRPMRTHHWSGLGTLIKNYAMFTPEPWKYHGNACEDLGALWHFPSVKGKTRLNILVMLTPLFHGIGPHHFSKQYTWFYGGLIVSRDPVAADTTGARIIQAKRSAFFKEERPISPPPRHIAVADRRYNLGFSDPNRIEVIRLGWEEDILI